jgi:beta-glucosidase
MQPAIERPLRELKGFAKLALQTGETKTVQFRLTPRDLAYYDEEGRQWKADAGQYQIEIGASSRDLRLAAPVQLSEEFTESVAGPKNGPMTSATR